MNNFIDSNYVKVYCDNLNNSNNEIISSINKITLLMNDLSNFINDLSIDKVFDNINDIDLKNMRDYCNDLLSLQKIVEQMSNAYVLMNDSYRGEIEQLQ